MSIVYRSVKGSKLTSDEVDGNFQYLESLVGGQGNNIISESGFALVGQDLTIAAGWIWRILNISYTNSTAVVLNIPLASSGNQRIDLIVANQSNTFERVVGVESASNPTAPPVPTNKILVTFMAVTDGDVGAPVLPIVGYQFKNKSENLGYGDDALSGTEAVIQLRPEGSSYYALGNAGLVSIDGFGLDLITGNPSAEVPYPLKDLFIQNTGVTPFSLLHQGAGDANSKFFFLDETDLEIPAGGIVWLKYNTTACQLFFKSWTDIDLSTKADLVGGKVPASQLPSYVDDVLEFADLVAFPAIGESGKIYLALDTNFTYRWSGSAYVQLGGGLKTESVTIANRWTLTNANVYYRSRGDFGGFNVDTLNVSTVVSTITSAVASTSSAFYCTAVSKALSKIYIDGSNVASTLTDFKLGVFAFQRANAVSPTAINIITIGEYTLTKASGDGSHFWEITPDNLEIPAGYLVSCVLMRTGGTGTEINCNMTFKFDDYVA